jgi:Ca2+-binding RTX toxin-like protein
MLVVTLVPQALSLGQQSSSYQSNNSAKASISITGVPHAGPGGDEPIEAISGVVRKVDFAAHKVVVYAYAGGTWWVQPTAANPLTDIDRTGKWETDTHLGSTYAALLVRQSFKPSATIGTLPNVQGDIVAIVKVAGVK